ncbi:hypothetical protein RJ640_024710 [Escallonia rubra]|uniref:DUF4283 domain-containing protein n=1 Tax=Escallonia rubra TaxID=112253 RepID=A0AA88QAW0_9ASTE|nr:hypothetical protein RJ640_024710 [Escallonia rubra]
MSSPSYGNTNTEASDSIDRRGWLILANSACVLDAHARWASTLVGKFVDFQKISTRRVQHEDARDLFLAGSPWNLCWALVILKATIPNTPLHEHRFNETTVWIQLQRLPYEYFNEEDAMLIARAAGPVVAVDWPLDDNQKYEYIQVSVPINPFKSVMAGTYVELLEEASYGVYQGFVRSALAPHLELLQQDHRALFDEQLLAWSNTNFNRTSHVQLVEVDGMADLWFDYHDRRHSMESEQSLEDLQALFISDDHSSETSSGQAGSNQPASTHSGQPSSRSPVMERGSGAQSSTAIETVETGGGEQHAAEVDSALSPVATWLRQQRKRTNGSNANGINEMDMEMNNEISTMGLQTLGNGDQGHIGQRVGLNTATHASSRKRVAGATAVEEVTRNTGQQLASNLCRQRSLFPDAESRNMSIFRSDHALISLNTKSIQISGSPMYRVVQHLRSLKADVKLWNRSAIGNLSSWISSLQRLITSGQAHVDT